MTQLTELARPVVAPSAGLHSHQRRRKIREIGQHLLAAEFLLYRCQTSIIDTEHMKHLLAHIHSHSNDFLATVQVEPSHFVIYPGDLLLGEDLHLGGRRRGGEGEAQQPLLQVALPRVLGGVPEVEPRRPAA